MPFTVVISSTGETICLYFVLFFSYCHSMFETFFICIFIYNISGDNMRTKKNLRINMFLNSVRFYDETRCYTIDIGISAWGGENRWTLLFYLNTTKAQSLVCPYRRRRRRRRRHRRRCRKETSFSKKTSLWQNDFSKTCLTRSQCSTSFWNSSTLNITCFIILF